MALLPYRQHGEKRARKKASKPLDFRGKPLRSECCSPKPRALKSLTGFPLSLGPWRQCSAVNQALMKNVALPVLVMGATGLIMAGFFFFGRSEQKAEASELSVSNPFSLQSAITFGLVFSAVLIATRLALTYLGNTWLPLIAFLSGLTDADAIAFSVSDAQQAGIITLDWASFNLVLGALANTFMKLLLVFMLGHRALFKRVLVSFLVIGIAGIVTMAFYYDF